jgi:hypothetical protein
MPGTLAAVTLIIQLLAQVGSQPAAAVDAAAVVDVAAATVERRQQGRQQPARERKRWASSLDLGFSSSSGNSDLTALSTGFRLRHVQPRSFKLDWSASFRYGESQGEVVARNLQSKLDFDMGAQARVAPFVFGAVERDPFRRLDLRARTGSGVRYTFYDGSSGQASVRAAAQYSRETFTAVAQRDPRSDAGWGLELKGQQQLGELGRIENTTTFDPVLGDIGDFNLDVRSKLSSRISRRLALTLSHTYSFESNPVPEVGRTDQRFNAGLTVEF